MHRKLTGLSLSPCPVAQPEEARRAICHLLKQHCNVEASLFGGECGGSSQKGENSTNLGIYFFPLLLPHFIRDPYLITVGKCSAVKQYFSPKNI